MTPSDLNDFFFFLQDMIFFASSIYFEHVYMNAFYGWKIETFSPVCCRVKEDLGLECPLVAVRIHTPSVFCGCFLYNVSDHWGFEQHYIVLFNPFIINWDFSDHFFKVHVLVLAISKFKPGMWCVGMVWGVMCWNGMGWDERVLDGMRCDVLEWNKTEMRWYWIGCFVRGWEMMGWEQIG